MSSYRRRRRYFAAKSRMGFQRAVLESDSLMDGSPPFNGNWGATISTRRFLGIFAHSVDTRKEFSPQSATWESSVATLAAMIRASALGRRFSPTSWPRPWQPDSAAGAGAELEAGSPAVRPLR